MAYGAILGQTASGGGGGGKRVCRFTVGTSTAGWTANDCDYLCDGTDDQVEINAAIQALPDDGGEVVILNGRYSITATIAVNRGAVRLSGNGGNTWLYRKWDSDKKEGIITLASADGNCCITNFRFYTPYSWLKSNNNRAILINKGERHTIINNICSGNSVGIELADYVHNNTIIGNACYNNSDSNIRLFNSSNNIITGNTCYGKSGIKLTGIAQNNTITGNTCVEGSGNGIQLTDKAWNNTITGNTCNNNDIGISLNDNARNNTITGNTCNNNDIGISLNDNSNNNTVAGNTCIRETGQSSDYTSSQYTIIVTPDATKASNNLIAGNNIMGKNYIDNGTNNTWANNKYN